MTCVVGKIIIYLRNGKEIITNFNKMKLKLEDEIRNEGY